MSRDEQVWDQRLHEGLLELRDGLAAPDYTDVVMERVRETEHDGHSAPGWVERYWKAALLLIGLGVVFAMSLGGRGEDDRAAAESLHDLPKHRVRTIEDISSLPADAQRVELVPIYRDALEDLELLQLLEALADFDAARVGTRLRGLSVDCSDSLVVEFHMEFDDRALARIARMSGLEEILMVPSTEVTPSGLLQLAKLPRLESLYLWNCRLGDDTLRALQSLPRLRRLGFVGYAGAMTSLAFLDSLPRITDLDLEGQWQLRASDLLPIRSLSRLRSLRLREVDGHHSTTWAYEGRVGDEVGVDDATLEWIGQIHSLEELILDRCGSITEVGVRALGSLSRLKVLGLDQCSRITREGFLALPSSIVELRARGTAVNGHLLARLAQLRHLMVSPSSAMGGTWMEFDGSRLESLAIGEGNFEEDLTPVPAAFLGRCSALRKLSIGLAAVSREHISAIGKMRELRKLELYEVPDFDQHMPLLAGLTCLEDLDIGANEELTGVNLDALRELPLRRLRIIRSLHEQAREIWPSAEVRSRW